MNVSRREPSGRWLERYEGPILQTRSPLVIGKRVINPKTGKLIYLKPTPYWFSQYDRGSRYYRKDSKGVFKPLGDHDASTYGLAVHKDLPFFKKSRENAYAKAYSALVAWQTDRVEGIVNVLEYTKTKNSLKDFGKDIDNLLRGDRKAINRRHKKLLKRSNYVKMVKAIASRNLAINFGILPTIYSGQSLVNLLSREAYRRVTYRGKYHENGNYKPANKAGTVDYDLISHVTIDGYLNVNNPGLHLAVNLAGNPATVIFEITKFSWFLDYFTGISSILHGLTALSGTTFDGYISTFTECKFRSRLADETYNRLDYDEHTTKYFTREVVDGKALQLPSLQSQMQFITNPFDGALNRVRESISVLIMFLKDDQKPNFITGDENGSIHSSKSRVHSKKSGRR